VPPRPGCDLVFAVDADGVVRVAAGEVEVEMSLFEREAVAAAAWAAEGLIQAEIVKRSSMSKAP
jgi:hypothetical protein